MDKVGRLMDGSRWSSDSPCSASDVDGAWTQMDQLHPPSCRQPCATLLTCNRLSSNEHHVRVLVCLYCYEFALYYRRPTLTILPCFHSLSFTPVLTSPSFSSITFRVLLTFSLVTTLPCKKFDNIFKWPIRVLQGQRLPSHPEVSSVHTLKQQ